MSIVLATATPIGRPFPAGPVDLQKELVPRPGATYFFRVTDESMSGAFIPAEALLVVDRAEKPRDGSIVLAVVEGEYAVRRLVLRLNRRELHPENERYKPIELTEFTQYEIWGVVTHILIDAKKV